MGIEVKLIINTKTGEKQLENFKKKAKQTGEESGDSFSEGFTEGAKKTGKSLLKIGAIVAASFATITAALTTKGVFNAVVAIEKIETKFEVLTGSVAGAQKQVKDILDLASSTPFAIQGLADTSAQLLAFGFAQDKVKGILTTLGDVAAGSGSKIQDIGRIFGQISGAGKLTGERFNQLQEKAINLGPVLAKNLGVANTEIRKMISDGKVGFKDVQKAFTDMTTKSGIFSGAMIKQSKTLGGLVSNLKDNLFKLQVVIGKIFGPTFKKFIESDIALVDKLTKFIETNSVRIVKGFASIARAIIKYVAKPLNFILNLGRSTFDQLDVAMDMWVGGMREKLGIIGRAMDSVGLGGDISASLIAQGEKGTAQLKESFAEFEQIKKDLFNFDSITGVEKLITELEDASLRSVAPMKAIHKNVRGPMIEVEKTVKGTGKAITKAVNQGMVKTMSAGISAMATSLLEGGEGFNDFGKKIAGILGGLATQLGETLLLAGIGIESLKSLGGTAAIAAGVGLIALGAILSSIGGGSAPATAPSGGGVASGLSDEDSSIDETDEEERQTNQTVQLVVQGDILDSEDTGNRLLALLNENFENTGGKFTGAQTA